MNYNMKFLSTTTQSQERPGRITKIEVNLRPINEEMRSKNIYIYIYIYMQCKELS